MTSTSVSSLRWVEGPPFWCPHVRIGGAVCPVLWLTHSRRVQPEDKRAYQCRAFCRGKLGQSEEALRDYIREETLQRSLAT